MPSPGAKNFRGEEIGPCLNEQCGHTDCALNRARAAALCHVCGFPVGYETRFYIESDGRSVHAACVES